MGKYTPLRSYLMEQDKDRVPMSFDEIERLIGEKLPASKKYPAWWSNNPSNNPMTREWIAAGFQSEDVDVVGESVVFRRVVQPGMASSENAGFGESPQTELERPVRRHPLFGRLKGVVTFALDFDPTEPGYPEWADELDRIYGPEERDKDER